MSTLVSRSVKKQVSKQVNKCGSMTLFKRVKSSHGLERVNPPNGDSIFDIMAGGTFSLEFLSICRVFDLPKMSKNLQCTIFHRFQIGKYTKHVSLAPHTN